MEGLSLTLTKGNEWGSEILEELKCVWGGGPGSLISRALDERRKEIQRLIGSDKVEN